MTDEEFDRVLEAVADVLPPGTEFVMLLNAGGDLMTVTTLPSLRDVPMVLRRAADKIEDAVIRNN